MAIAGDEQKKIELYEWLLEGTDTSIGEYNSENDLFVNTSAIYMLRVSKGLEETTAYSD